jgi:phosphonate degradation associated HDIG domain protein
VTPAEEITALFEAHGEGAYFGEDVTQLAHALQAADWAVRAGADEETVVAALIHDIGHFLEGQRHAEIGVIDHDQAAEIWLADRGFSPRLIQLVRGHVDAKRYQVAVNPDYRNRLSEASKQTLALQGGPMTEAEANTFASHPLFREMIRLRQWDELAKDPSAMPPDWSHYEPMIERVWRASQN